MPWCSHQRPVLRGGLDTCAGLGFHDLRHPAVPLLLALGVPPHVVREIAGHSDIKVTLMVYAHGNVTEKAAALARLGQALSGGLMSPADLSEAVLTCGSGGI